MITRVEVNEDGKEIAYDVSKEQEFLQAIQMSVRNLITNAYRDKTHVLHDALTEIIYAVTYDKQNFRIGELEPESKS